MRFAAAVVSSALLISGTAAAARASTQMDRAGFTLAVPSDWTERPSVEKATVDGFHQSDAQDADTAFAWNNADGSVVVIVQSMASAAQIKAGTYRSNSTALVQAVVQSMGMTGAHSTIGDDGTAVTGNAEGDLGAMHVVMINEGMVDSTQHLRGYAVMCGMRTPVTDESRTACTTLLNSFKVTLDPSTLLPLEAK